MGKGKGLMPEGPGALRAKQITSTRVNKKAAQTSLLGLFFNVKGLSAFSQIEQLDVPNVDVAADVPVVVTPSSQVNAIIEPIEPTAAVTEEVVEEDASCDEEYFAEDVDNTYFDCVDDSDFWLEQLENKKRGGLIQRSKAEDAHGFEHSYRKSEIRVIRSNGSAHISAAASRKESARASEVAFANSKNAANREKALVAKNLVRASILPPPVFAPTPAPPVRPNYSRNPTNNSRSRTRRPRDEELSPEDQAVAAAIRASLAEDAHAFGGLTYQQLLELQTRDLTPEDYERLLMLDNTVKPKTLTADAISQFTRSKASCCHKEQLCTVCQMNYSEGEEILTLKCGHYFHADCITQWLSNSSTKCPIDGLSLTDD